MLTRLLRIHLAPYRREIAAVVLLLTVQAVANLYLPTLNADIINNGVVTGNISYIVRIGAIMLGVTVLAGVVSVIAVYFASRVAMGSGRDLRGAVFARVQRFSAREMSTFGTPSLITRNTNDVQQVQVFVQAALTLMVVAPITCLGGIVMAIHESARLSLLLIVAVPLMAAVVVAVLVTVVPQFRSMQIRLDRINLVLREQITGVRVIRAFVRGQAERDRFSQANTELTAVGLRVNRLFALTLPVVMLILNLSSVAVLWFGGHLVADGSMPIGNLTAFLTYILQILLSVMMAVFVAILMPRAMASADRIMEVLDVIPAVSDPPVPTPLQRRDGSVELDAVSFGYPGGERPVLQDLTCTFPAGKTSAIIGGTGSGKTTLLNLIPRFFDANSGRVSVNGVDVREQVLEELWSTVGLVPQASYLFSGTIASNLRVGRADATNEEMWKALEIAQAREFVEAMPGGLDAPVDQGGTNVSGGQRQRLSIARALIKRPQLYLFDDCFSALDAATDARLRGALRSQVGGAAVIIVAQRVSTVMHADQIVVLDEGRIVGLGTHGELMAGCDAYHEIVVSQLGEAAA